MRFYELSTYAFYGAIAAGIVCSVIANAKLHPDKKDPFRVFFWRDKSDFSEQGWKFRQASSWCVAIAVGLMLLSKALQFLQAH